MAKTPIKRTGITQETAKSFVINAGAIYTDLTFTEGTGWEGNRLGATAGGNAVVITNDLREIEIDGAFSKYIGQKVLTASNATLTTNVKEITSNVIKTAILGKVTATAGVDEPTGYDLITGKGKIEATDYLTNIGLVGELTGSNEPIIVILDNALCTSGLNITTGDNGEAVVAMTFEAHADADQLEDRTLPARIYMPKVA
ncbi:hypothetical protein [Jeotgalibaca porci]|uniref:hypothetical protein n=1 Tax=Jeotgalibaca porci TaxID=1868793 RepID=UPI00359F2397